MAFKTRIDASDNRQFKQRERTETAFPGVTRFGLPQEELSVGPDLNSIRVLIPSVNNITSTFTGDLISGVYNYSFGYTEMGWAEGEIVHFDLNSNEGESQDIGITWVGVDPITVNGETIYTRYEGVKFDLTLAEIIDEGNDTVSGSTRSTFEKFEADALDYNGDYIWVHVQGNIQTENIFVKQIGIGPSVTDLGSDADGKLVAVASDIRLKENIEPIKNALEKVLGLKGVMYNWKDRALGSDAVRIGFIAQQVMEIVPELVYTQPNSDYLSVYYNNVIPIIIEAIKELKEMIGENQNNTQTTTQTKEINVEIITSEDNAIELNFGGTHQTALNGGIIITNGVAEGIDASIGIDENGDWMFEPGIVLPKYTPKSTSDPIGNNGNIAHDDEFFYIKTQSGWKRTRLQNF